MELEEFLNLIKKAAEHENFDGDINDLSAEDRANLINIADEDGAYQDIWSWGYKERGKRENIDELKSDLSALRTERDELQGKIDDLQGQIDDESGSDDPDVEELKSLRKQRDQLQEQLKEIKQEKQDTVGELQTQLNDVRRKRVLDKVRVNAKGKLKDVYLDTIIPTLEDRVRLVTDDDGNPNGYEILQDGKEIPMTADDQVSALTNELVENADSDFVISSASGGSGAQNGQGGGGGSNNLVERMREQGEKTFSNDRRERAQQKRQKAFGGEG